MAMALKFWKTTILARKFQNFVGRKQGAAPTNKKPASRRVSSGSTTVNQYL